MTRCRCIFFLTVFLLGLVGAAGAQPVPATLRLAAGEAVPGFIRGAGFGPAADDVPRPGPVVSVQDLRSCLVLADTLALAPDRWAHVVRTIYWRDDMVAFSLNGVPPAGRDCLYFFVFDAQGTVSLPIGPLPAVGGYLVQDDAVVLLAEATWELWDGSQTNLLSPEGQDPVPDCLEFDASRLVGGPGIPGQPHRTD